MAPLTAVQWARGFNPSAAGIPVSLACGDAEQTLRLRYPKTKIMAENRGYFATLTDSEGHKVGLYSYS